MVMMMMMMIVILIDDDDQYDYDYHHYDQYDYEYHYNDQYDYEYHYNDQYYYDDNIIIMTIEVKNRFLIKNVFTQDTDVSKAVNSVYYLLELQRR